MSHSKERPVMDHEKIEATAKKIMDDFLKELSASESPTDFGLCREGLSAQVRDPKHELCDPRFRGGMFANARAAGKDVKNDELVMERKQW